VLICPDKFKFSLTATQVAECIAHHIPSSIHTKIITLADGGEGSVDRISQEI
jgi:glycerate kinase